MCDDVCVMTGERLRESFTHHIGLAQLTSGSVTRDKDQEFKDKKNKTIVLTTVCRHVSLCERWWLFTVSRFNCIADNVARCAVMMRMIHVPEENASTSGGSIGWVCG